MSRGNIDDFHQFVDRAGVLKKVTREGAKPLGRAYGFFDAKVPYEHLKQKLPEIKRMANSPSDLELTLTPGEPTNETEVLKNIAKAARVNIIYPSSDTRSLDDKRRQCENFRNKKFDYTIRADYLNHNPTETANELASVMNVIYQETNPNKPFRSAIVFKQDGQYVSRD